MWQLVIGVVGPRDIAKRLMGKNIKFGPGGMNTMDL